MPEYMRAYRAEGGKPLDGPRGNCDSCGKEIRFAKDLDCFSRGPHGEDVTLCCSCRS